MVVYADLYGLLFQANGWTTAGNELFASINGFLSGTRLDWHSRHPSGYRLSGDYTEVAIR
jgi:hypothetical protein